MELIQIEDFLASPDPQKRMKGITELRNYEPELVVPLLSRIINDKEFVVRSFAVMGLGFKQTREGFELLISLLKDELDPNVRAQVASSLSKYGEESFSHLVGLFERDYNWLVRHSILASIDGKKFPEILLKLCSLGIEDNDLEVRLASIATLSQLQSTSKEAEALELILNQVNSQNSQIKIQVANILPGFDDHQAKSALLRLRNDDDYRVVGATLENLL
jgi:HEAT repeat protein